MINFSKKQTGLLAGSSINLLFSFINYGLRFIISVIVARSLGVSGKGTYTLVLTTGSLLALFLNPGLSSALTYLSASKKFSSKNLFGYGLWISVLGSISGGFLFLGVYWFLLQYNLLKGVSVIYIGLILIFAPIYLITIQTTSILLGRQQLLAVNIVDLFRSVVNLTAQIFSWRMEWGFSGTIGAWLFANLAALGAALWIGRDMLSISFTKPKEIFTATAGYGSKSYLSNILSFFNYRLDSYIVNYYLGSEQVGLYSTGVSMAELLWYIPNAVSGALFPKIPTLENKVASQLTARTCRQVFSLIFIGAILFRFLGKIIIVMAYGQEFQPSTAPFLWLLPGILGMTISKIISADLSGRGKPEYSTKTSGLTLVITIIGDIILIPALGISGAALASSLAYITSAIVSVIWFRKETGTSIGDLLILKPSDLQLLQQRLSSAASNLLLKLTKK